jgi:hypothetical protein
MKQSPPLPPNVVDVLRAMLATPPPKKEKKGAPKQKK